MKDRARERKRELKKQEIKRVNKQTTHKKLYQIDQNIIYLVTIDRQSL